MDKKEKLTDYAIFNTNGFIIDKSDKGIIQQNIGQLNSIKDRVRKMLDSNDTINSIEIYFEKGAIIMRDNSANNITMAVGCCNKK